MGDDCIKIEQNNDEAIAYFENGKKKSSDLIIIANGIKSDLRSYVDKSAHPQYAEYVVGEVLLTKKKLALNH